MECNCSKAYPLVQCITDLQIGVVDPGLSDLIVQFECAVTGRIQRIEDVTPSADGILIVDVSTLNNFFSPNFELELTVLASLENGGDIIPVSVADTTFDCVLLNFISGETEFASIALLDDAVQHLRFTTVVYARYLGITIPATFEGVFIADLGDGNKRRLYSAGINSYVYADGGSYNGDVRGHFQDMTSVSMSASKLTHFLLPTTHSITALDLSSNNIPVFDVNNILLNLDQNGLATGSVNLSGQVPAAIPTGAGLLAKTNLQVKGWTVTTD